MKTFKGARVCPLIEPAITYTSASVQESDFFWHLVRYRVMFYPASILWGAAWDSYEKVICNLRPSLIGAKSCNEQLTPQLKNWCFPGLIELPKKKGYPGIFRRSGAFIPYYSSFFGGNSTAHRHWLLVTLIPTSLRKSRSKKLEPLRLFLVGGSKCMKKLQQTAFFAAYHSAVFCPGSSVTDKINATLRQRIPGKPNFLGSSISPGNNF